jgi:ribosomal-protein-alanine N-acetyltransferase
MIGTAMNVNIRSVKLVDLPAVLLVENASFSEPWNAKDFRIHLSQRTNFGMLAEIEKEVVGYIVYRVEGEQMFVLSMAVMPRHRRNGIGTMLVATILPKMKTRKKIRAIVSDQFLDAHLFLRSLGFKALKVKRNYCGPDHDGYDFVHESGRQEKSTKIKQEVCK